MCPVCIATAAQMVAGATSVGGLIMLATKAVRAKGRDNISIRQKSPKGEKDESSKNRIES